MKGVQIVRYLNQSRTWHITAYSWEEMSIASCDDLIVEWIALSAVWCWKVWLVDQLCRFYSDSPYRNEPTCWSHGVLSSCHCAFSLLSSQRTRTHMRHFRSAKIDCYCRFHFNRREKNYWLKPYTLKMEATGSSEVIAISLPHCMMLPPYRQYVLRIMVLLSFG